MVRRRRSRRKVLPGLGIGYRRAITTLFGKKVVQAEKLLDLEDAELVNLESQHYSDYEEAASAVWWWFTRDDDGPMDHFDYALGQTLTNKDSMIAIFKVETTTSYVTAAPTAGGYLGFRLNANTVHNINRVVYVIVSHMDYIWKSNAYAFDFAKNGVAGSWAASFTASTEYYFVVDYDPDRQTVRSRTYNASQELLQTVESDSTEGMLFSLDTVGGTGQSIGVGSDTQTPPAKIVISGIEVWKGTCEPPWT